MHIALRLSCALALASAPLAQGQISGRTDDRAEAGTLRLDEIRASLEAPGAHEPFVPSSPLGLPEDLARYIPADNPMTPAKVELGRQLYFDKRLSADNTISCATCHDPAKGWTDNDATSVGIRGQRGGRSAPTVINRILGPTQFWDGRAPSLEDQAVGPIGNPIEMGFDVDGASKRLNDIEGYRLQFDAVFGGPATPDRIGQAIATFERTVLSGWSKLDYYWAAEPWFGWDPETEEDEELRARGIRILDQEFDHRLSASADRGRQLFFGKANCSACHVGADLSDEDFHNIGIGMDTETPDLGRFDVTGEEKDKGAFRTTSLRNIMLTAPYMHDGSLATLREVVEHYDEGGTKSPWLSDKVFPLNLSEQEKQDLVRFLEEGLTGWVTEVEVPRLP